MTDAENDGLDLLANILAIRRSGLHRHENRESGATALFPSVPMHTAGSAQQMALENTWEEKAIAQNAEAQRLEHANRLKPKVVENRLARVVRGD